MTTIDATVMQQALEALELANRTSYSESNCIKFSEAIKSIRAAIAQPVQPAAVGAVELTAKQTEPVRRSEITCWMKTCKSVEDCAENGCSVIRAAPA